MISISFRALTVPIHLGPILTDPLCPISCYQLSGALLLAKVPDGPPDLTFKVLWVCRRGTQVCILFFFLKSPIKRTPSGSPTGPLWRELPAYNAPFFDIAQSEENCLPSDTTPIIRRLVSSVTRMRMSNVSWQCTVLYI